MWNFNKNRDSKNKFPLTGIWRRCSGSLLGSLISVTQKGKEWEGRLLTPNNAMQEYGWRGDELKWRGIKRRLGNRFVFEDLTLEYDTQTRGRKFRYSKATLVHAQAHRLKVKSKGVTQIWIRER